MKQAVIDINNFLYETYPLDFMKFEPFPIKEFTTEFLGEKHGEVISILFGSYSVYILSEDIT